MTTTAKSKTPTKRAASVLVAPARRRATPLPFLRFYHSKQLREKTELVLTTVETEPHHPRHADAVADLVTELIEAGMDYYFLKALTLAEVGFISEQSARLGMSGAVKLISSVSRKFILRMDQAQIRVVATHIRSLATA
jgi:hypothetical protein